MATNVLKENLNWNIITFCQTMNSIIVLASWYLLNIEMHFIKFHFLILVICVVKEQSSHECLHFLQK